MRIKKRNDTEIKKMNQHSGRIEDVDLILNALSSASEGIAIVDENDNLIYLNRAYADIFGFALEELLGINWRDRAGNGTVASAGEELLRATLEKRSTGGQSLEHNGFRNDGSIITVKSRTVLRQDKTGLYKGFISYVNDITELKKTERELLLLKRAVETSGEAIFMTDAAGIFTFINPEFTSLYGYEAEEVIGKSTPLVLRSNLISQEEAERVEIKLKNRESCSGSWINKTRLGQLVNVAFTISPIMDENGQLSGYLAIQRDVTEKVNALEALKNSERLLSDIINSLPEPTFVINKEHQVIIWNKAVEVFTGIKAEDILLKDDYIYSRAIFGKNRPIAADLLLDPDPAYENLYLSFQRYENLVITEINTRIPTKTEDVYVWAIASKLFDAGGNLIGAIQTLRDITGLKKIEQELRLTKEIAEEHNRLKSHFIASMSHELRTPLVGILGFSEILLGETEDEEMHEKVSIIFNSGRRLLQTLNSILDFSKLESNHFEIHKEEVDLPNLMQGIIRMYEPHARQKNLHLSLEINDEYIVTRLDKSILLHALKNLLSNAIKFTSKGEIKASVFKEFGNNGANWVSISIKDTGIGISQENQKFIFEPFRQVSEGFNRKYEGTGLGLTLTKKYVELMDGKITFWSRTGEGTTVKISLPLSPEESLVQKEVPDSENGNSTDSIQCERKRVAPVLFVEDDSVSQTVMKLFLKGLCELETATDGETALKMLTSKQYSAILMDINLEGELDGLETTAALRELPQYKSVPVIAVTAYATPGEKEWILSQGCNYYLTKPFTRLDITGLIKQILEI